MSLSNVSGLQFDGIAVSGSAEARGSDHLTITNSSFNTGLFFRDVSNLTVKGSDIANGHNGLTMDDVSYFTIVNNKVHDSQSDLMRVTGNSHHGVISNNSLIDARAQPGDHPDAIQFFAYGGYTPHDIQITGNFIHDDPSTGSVYMQGIFVSDPGSDGYRNFLIEDNLVSVGSPNSIYLWGGTQNFVIQNNSLLSWEADGGGAAVRLVGDNPGTTVTNNVALDILNEGSGATVSNNIDYSNDRSSPLYWGKLFQGTGETWQGFLPVDGSVIDFGSGKGALDRLTELLGGDPVPVPDPKPDPTPDPDPSPAPAGVLLDRTDLMDFNGSNASVEVLANKAQYQTAEGTIAFDFKADSVSGGQGLFSKDAANFGNGGHFVARIANGDLYVRFQNTTSEKVFLIDGINANQHYEFAASFGKQGVAVWLDGERVASSSFQTSWENNKEAIQIGGNGWGSAPGGSDFVEAFSGQIGNLVIVDQVLDPTGVDKIVAKLDGGLLTNDADVYRAGDSTADLVIDGGGGNDLIVTGLGDDSVRGGTGHDVINTGGGNDQITAGRGSDTVYGQGGDDWLRGQVGNDQLFGQGGSDRIIGHEGNDTLSGGAGSDTFCFTSGGPGEKDIIQDYNKSMDVLRIDTTPNDDVNIRHSGTDSIINYDDNLKHIVVVGQHLVLDDLTLI